MSATDLSSRLSSLSPAQRALLELALRKKNKPAEAPQATPAPVPTVIPPRAQHDHCPLSIDQERLWFIQQLDLASPIYNIYSAHRHKGPLDAGLFTRALDIVVARHEILRTRFPAIDGRPVQEIAPTLRTSMLVVDLRGLRDLPRVVREDEAYRIAMMACREPFALSCLPLFHSVLVQVDDEDFIHPISIHHIITDRVAAYVFENEVTELYRMLSTGQPPVLPPVGLQFADFAVWQREHLKDEAVMAEHVAYWRAKLADAPELSTLPPDRPRPAVQTPWGARRRIAISTAMADEFRAFSKAMDVTMFISGLAIWKSVLVRLSGQDKMIVGTPMNYRQVLDVPHVLGFFLNQIPLYTDLGGDPTFREILGRVRTTSLEAYAHHELPFARMVELLRPERDLSRVPYTQVVFLLLDPPQTGWASMPGIESRPYWMDAQRTQFDMNMALFWVEDTGLTGMLEYNTDLFDAVTMDRVKQQFRLILGAVLDDPDRRLSDLPLLSEAQRHQVVQEWSAPRLPPAPSEMIESTLHGAFAAQAARDSEAPAVTYEDTTLSYGDLNRRANRLAHRLLALGARGDLVALAAGRGLDLIACILGILKAGCAYVPIDPAQPAERLAFLLADCGAAILVADAAARESFPAWHGRTLALEEALEAGTDQDPDVFADAGSPAYVIYTSGSTGQPKGVVVTHGNVLRLFSATDPLFGFGADDTWTLFHSFAFDFSVWELWGALLHGGRLVVVPYWVSRSPEAFAGLLSRERVTVLNQTPKAFRQLIPEMETTDLRWVILGGEALQASSLAPWIERFGDESPALVNMYGITETTVHVTFHRVLAREIATSWTSRIGTPIPDLALRVLDPYGTPAPMGVEGEMCVGGPGLAMGYLGRPDLTAERFVPDFWSGGSAAPGGRLYRSGDLGRFRPDSGLEYLRRADHQVKVRGFRIELGEIEAALTAHPRVAAAAVLALADGAGDSRLISYLVGKDGEMPGVEELRSHLALRLPEHMLPAVFIPLAALPLTANGKLDRRALPAPGIERPELATAYAAPTNATEEALAAIWAEILGVEKAGIHDNFFSLGGDSIISLRVVALAAKRGISTSLQDIFRHQTIARIAAAASTEVKASAQEAGRGAFSLLSEEDRRRLPNDLDDLEDAYPLTELQAGMLYHMALTPDEPLYHDVGSFHLRARFEPAVFRQAVDRVTARHAVLRTSFDLSVGSEPLQLVHRHAVVPIEVEDWQGLSAAEQEAAVERRIKQETLTLFDLSRAPHLRFHIAPRSPETFQLTLAENHALFDGWSLHSTVTEIFELYFALLDGTAMPPTSPTSPTSPPPPSITFRDYVRLEREALASPEAAAYWEQALADLPPAELPVWPVWSHWDDPTQSGGLRVRTRREFVPAALLTALQETARRAGVPFKSLLLGAHARVLSHLCGRPEVVTGLVTNGRLEETGGDEVRGLFLNTLPLRLAPPAGDRPSWLDLARETFRAEQEMLPFRRTPYAALQRRAGGQPLYEMAFNYVHFHVARGLAESGRLGVLGVQMVEAASFKLLVGFTQTPTGDALACDLEYDAHELPDAQVQMIAGTYLRCLAALAADPDAPFAAVSLLSAAERHQLLHEQNDTAAPLGSLTVAALFAAQAAHRPAAVAVVSDSGDLSYGDLDAQANRLARHLLAAGAKPEAPIGVCAERGPHLAVALLAVLKAGGAYLPLDPGQPRERLELILEDAGCTTVLAEEQLRGVLPDVSETSGLRIISLTSVTSSWHAESAAPPALPLLPGQLAYVIYTSGSTGRPKGIGLPHRVLLNLVTWQIGASRDSAARTLQFAAPSFDVSLQEMLATWCAGGTLVAAPEEARRDAGLLAHLLCEKQIERLFLPFVALRQLAEQMSEQAEEFPIHLREVITAGERLQVTPQLRSFFHDLPACTLRNQYGPSETHVITEHILTGDPASWPTLPPIGRPIANTRAYLLGVLDSAFRPVPVGTPGELLLGGEGLARGYVGRADWTAERFVPDGVSSESGARLYRTGDLARLRPDGAIEFLGRIDHQVKIRGFRVEPEEIEAALQAHPAVRESAVVAVEIAGGIRLIAFVVVDPIADLAGAMRRFLGLSLPAYMIPAAFVPLAALPRTRSGKADRRALAKRAPEVAAGASDTVRHGVAPRGPVEEAVAAIWREVLHTGAVSVHDSFFDLGGHSLLATQAISRVRSAFGIDLPLARLFEAPTVAGLARQIERGLRRGRRGRRGELPEAAPLVRQARTETAPLSFAQERLWFLDRLAPGSAVYNIPLALRLDGALSLPALAAAVGEVVRRHEALRTVFAEGANGPVQLVHPANDPVTFVLPAVDLSGLGERAEEEALRLARDEAGLPFDLARGPLFRTRRLHLPGAGGEASLLLATMHHVISDGWSLSVLVREIGSLYAAFTRGLPSPLPELPIQYPDFALWQRSWLTGDVLAAQIGYWRETLAGLPPLLPLPIDRPRPQTPSFHGAHVATALSAALTAALHAQGRRAGATPFMLLLAGVQALFARLTGEDDLAVGTAIAGRGQVETEELIGFFVNSLVLRGRLDGDPALPELLARVRATALGAYAHQDLPFERLVAELGVERSLSHAPLFQVMVTLQNTPREILDLPGLRLSSAHDPDIPGETAKSDLTITLSETGPEIAVDWEYATDLFDGPTIERMATGFERLLASWLETPSLHLADLPLLGESEARQVAAWSRPQPVATAPSCLHELFTAAARRNPGAVAVSSEGSNLTYGDLDQQSDRLARRLLRAGLGSGDAPVAICIDRSPEMLVGLLAILKTGRAYLPLDPDHPAERKAFLLHDARAELLLTRHDLQAGLPPHEAKVVLIEDEKDQKDQKDGKDTKDRDERLETLRVPPESPAYVLYTSGSTGVPKGVAVSHAAVARLFTAAAPRAGFTAHDVWPLFHSYAFDVSVWEMWGALLYGGRLVVVPYWVSRSPEEFLALLARERVTVLNQTPSAFRQLLTAASRPDLALRLVIFAGEALEPASLAPWFDRHGDEHPALINMYGITETTVHVTWRRMHRGDLEHPALGSPIGEPLADLSIVLTDRTLQPVPQGVPGEICVGGAGLAQGYLRRPDLTAVRFIPNPFGTGERLYRSGDLARRLPDGSLEYLGRTDHQVKVRGFRIELGEIEAALLRHPDVEQAIVAVIPDVEGKGNRLAAYLVARRSDDGLFADLQRHLRDTLPEPMIPGAWVRLAAMPLTPSGKLDRRGLPGPDTDLGRAAAPQGVAPRGPVEEAVAAIWRKVLHIDLLGAVSAHDSFFDLGGHSLLATQVISRVRSVFGIDLPLVRLFETPTVAGLARQIETLRRGGLPVAPPVLRQARRDAAPPLSFAQERLWFLDRLAPGTAVYNIPLALRLDGALDLPALAAAVGEVVRRHESLRTVFTQSAQNTQSAGQPVQTVRPADDPAAFTVPTVDLSGLGGLDGRAEDEALRLSREEAALPFDLARGPLFRTRRLRLPENGGETSLLLATMHHVISDGWSLSVLVREIGALYAAFTRGLPSPLSELPIQYPDFALWQRSWLTGEVLAAQIRYWREALAGLPPLLPLPADRPRPQTPSFRGAHATAILPASLTAALHAHGRHAGATSFMLLIAVFQALFARLTGEDDLAVGTAIAGRGQVETEPLIGFFVNSLVLRGRLDGDPALPELLARVRTTALDAYPHQDLPFERLVAELGVERSLAHTPLFQVMVTLQNTPQETLDLPGLRLSPVEVPGETAKSDLTITLSETGPEIAVDWEYATDLFDGTTVDRMAAGFERLLAAWLETPSLRLADLPLLGESEAHQIAAWSRPQCSQTAATAPACLHESFAAAARRNPGSVAVSCDGKNLTYGDLDQQSDRLARRLLGMGLGDAPVAICIDRSLEMLVGLLAILKTGRAYLPLDPDHPADRKAFILRDARAELLLTRKDLQADLPPHEARVVLIEDEKDQKDCKDTQDRDQRLETLRVPPESPAYVLYTSGSTGEPKGVAVSHGAVARLFTAAAPLVGFSEHDVWTLFHSYAFDFSVWEMWGALLYGGKLVVVPYWVSRSPEEFLALLARERVTVLNQTPSAFRQLSHLIAAGSRSDLALRLVIFGGEALEPASLAPWFERHGDEHPALINMYGITETTVHVTWRRMHRDDLTRPALGSPIGEPLADLAVVLTDRTLQPVPSGVPGEICVGGAGLAQGYLRRPDLTATRFVPHPFGDGERLYRSGDLARRLPDGPLEYLGRTDHQVKVRGFRIELGEIEAALLRHPDVEQAIVAVNPEATGLAAYLVSQRTDAGLFADLQRHLRESLPEPMIPAVWLRLAALPLTPSGKIDRRGLPAPDTAPGRATGTEFVAPRTPLEEHLAEVFAEVLNIEPGRIGIHDNFFDLGGHSLLATVAIAHLRDRWDFEIPLRTLFEATDLADLADRITEQEIQAAPDDLVAELLASLQEGQDG